MTASEHSSSLKLGIAEWPVSGNRYFRLGSVATLHPAIERHQAGLGQKLPVIDLGKMPP